jgi:DNA-binding transcriptional LysR family regulator
MSNFLRETLALGQIDMAIRVGKTADAFVSHPIVEDEMVVVAGSTHPIFRKRPRVQDLAAIGGCCRSPPATPKSAAGSKQDAHH